MALPPRLLIPFFLAIGTVLNYLFCYEVFILWLVGLAANVIANMISIPLAMFNKSSFIAICSLPKAMFIMFFALFKMKNANKTFIHTPHGSQ